MSDLKENGGNIIIDSNLELLMFLHHVFITNFLCTSSPQAIPTWIPTPVPGLPAPTRRPCPPEDRLQKGRMVVRTQNMDVYFVLW